MLVEACVDSVESAVAAERGGAGRLELCDNMCDAGTTPSAGMIAAVKAAVQIPVVVIVRPRGGDFVYSPSEVDVMMRDIDIATQLGADGIAIGALTRQATIDEERTRAMRDAANGLAVTFHRAFDLVSDQERALEALVAAEVTRVLTSGGAQTAREGADAIAGLVRQSNDRIAIMAGGGIREANVAELVWRTGVREVHVRPTRLVGSSAGAAPTRVGFRKPLPADEDAWEEIDEARIREIVRRASS